MLTPHSPCHFISRALTPYTAQIKRSCVKGQPEEVVVSVHAAAELSRLVTYDNATVGAAAVRQLHKRARRCRPPARRGLSRYLPAILPFAHSLSLAAPVAVSILFSGGRRRRHV